ncbi:MAG TPA: hypothetical protein VKB49_32430 [Candidatus Sulfotelmatobacter sp.]|nr:hypothetical protein [Candidatus Sulfotelmatobacter sp.]
MRWLHNPLVIAVVGISFRILLIPSVLNWLGTPTDHFQGNEPSHIAAHLIRGEGFGSPFTDLAIPTAQQPPLYPLFIAGIFKLFGAFSRTSLYLILTINCVAGGVTAFFIHKVGSKYFSPVVASLSAWTWSVLGPIAVTDITITGYAFAALTVVVWLNVVPSLSPKIGNHILLGIALAFMLLLNPMLALLMPASVLWLNKRQTLVIMVSALLFLTPWYVRNYHAMGHFYPALRDNLGMELYLGNHPGMSGTCDYWTGESPYGGELPRVGEARFFELRRREAIAYIMTAPSDFIVRSIKRFGRFWFSPWPVVYIILFVLAIWGLRFSPRPFSVFSIILFVFYPLIFYVTQTAWATAYRHPIEPIMLLMAAQPVSSWLRLGKAETGAPSRT